MIGETVGNFHIVEQIGEGGMGVVYLAQHVDLPILRSAIKGLSNTLSSDPHFRDRFRQEVRNQAALRGHPNIVHVRDFVEVRGRIFLVMDYIDGPDLGKFIKTKEKTKERLTQAEVLEIFKGILKGMAFAHSKGIIHRDLKPANILIENGSNPRINDFGIAILAGAHDERLTGIGTAVGSPCYMSPEQITRPQQIDHRSDIYSLGIVLYEMLTGEVPFDGDTAFVIHNQQVHSPVPDPSKKNSAISSELVGIIQKAMAKEPDARFQHCSEFQQCIEALSIPRIEALSIPPEKPSWLFYATLSIVCILIMLAILGRYQPQPPTPPPVISVPPSGDTDMLRQLAAGAIDTGAKGAWILCTQLKQIEAKKEGPGIARQIGDTNNEELLTKQLQDLRNNVEKILLPEHTEALRRLGEIGQTRAQIVDEEFDHYARTVTDKEAFGRIQGARILKDHYQRYRKDQKSVSLESITAACAQAVS